MTNKAFQVPCYAERHSHYKTYRDFQSNTQKSPIQMKINDEKYFE